MSALTVRVEPSIARIDRAAWNRLAGPKDPFVRHEFLAALENTDCVGAGAGWQVLHLAAYDADQTLRGVLPLYAKSHSQGEYIFDHGWADAFARAGGQYYPKLQSAVPFTPVPGPRLLAQDDEARAALVAAALRLVEDNGLSSYHVTFCQEDEAAYLESHGFLRRLTEQFHWRNEGYGSFEDFLAALSSRKRKTIRREREAARQSGIDIQNVEGADLTSADWDAFYEFYLETGSRKWGRPYLNRAFFEEIAATMSASIMMTQARRAGRLIAGALHFKGTDALYGRYWGAIEHHPFLHFECCYYQAMDYAVAHRLPRVEAGAQGEHKLLRGYMPVAIHSAHWIADEGFRAAVARYLRQERGVMDEEMKAQAAFAPFRKGDPPRDQD